MIPYETLNKMTVAQLKDTKDMIDITIKLKVKSELKVGSEVYIVQKTKKTPGVIKKIMQSRCLVKMRDMTYRVPMSMLEIKKVLIMKTEKEEVKTILVKHNLLKSDIETITDPESKVYSDLYEYFMSSGDIPYGIVKCRTGDPVEWISDKLVELQLV